MATAAHSGGRAEVRSAVRELVRSFNEHNLLTWASALAFQVVMAIVPFLLFSFALLGFLNLESVWADVAKNIKPDMSGPAFQVVDTTVREVLTSKQAFWLTAGFVLAMWAMSRGIRTVMGGLARIYAIEETRSWTERMRTSIVLAMAVSALMIAAIAVVWGAPLLYGNVGRPLDALLFLARWIVAGGLLGLAVGLTVRYAPDGDQPIGWVSAGTAIVVAAWSLTSILFGAYIRYVASYGSVFGNLATIVVLLIYVYLSSIAFFAGAQLDAIIRRRVEGNPRGS